MKSVNSVGIGMKSENKMAVKEIVLMAISVVSFLAMSVFGAVKLMDVNYSAGQAALILIQGIAGLALSWFPLIFLRVFKLRISFALQAVAVAFMFMAMILGEAFEFYYLIPWWDSLLHAFSGFGIAFAAFCLINTAIKHSNLNNKFLFCLIGATVISCAVGFMWEVAEFSIDSIFGTNMQKFVPDTFFNGGNTREMLVGSAEEIAALYSSPEGYRFALTDTMKDIILCLGGTTIFALLAAVTKKSSVYSTAIEKVSPAHKRKARVPASEYEVKSQTI